MSPSRLTRGARAAYRSPWRTPELDDVAALVRTFFDREIAPHRERFARQHEVDREVWRVAGRIGLLCPGIPTEYGGGGGSFAHEAVVLEELARSADGSFGFAVHSTIVAPYVLAYGTSRQRRSWLPRLASGECVGAIAMTEPDAGSDLQAISTTARRDGDEYVVDGAKTFISNGTHADLVLVVVRTGADPVRGLSLLGVEPADLTGFARGRVLEKVGQPGQDTRELSFTQMRVPAANLLGGREGEGFGQLMAQLPQERLAIAVGAVAAMEAAVDLATAYAKDRRAFGRDLLSFQNTRFLLAECTADALAARTLVDHCIQLHLGGRLDAATASLAKFWTTEQQGRVVDRCVQVFGGYGYLTEYPIARLYAAARVSRIYGGANEIMKEMVARTL